MAIQSYTEQLEECQAAIKLIMTGGQSVNYDGRQRTEADLKALQEREVYLQTMVKREARGGVRMTQLVPRD